MIYPYKCPDCKHYIEDIRPASQCHDVTVCPKCGQVMARVYTPVAGRIDMIKSRPPAGAVELGNERVKPQSQVKDYDDRGLREELNSGRYPELAGLSA